MAILKPSSYSSKQKRNKAPVAKKCRPKSKQSSKQLRFAESFEFHDSNTGEEDLYARRHEIWYTREEYSQFHVDRYNTIQTLRAAGSDVRRLDTDIHCCRGLEPFWTPQGHRQLQGSRKLHKSTVMLEQARQNLTQIKDADRFRVMVASQSDEALKRAQELAALDEMEAHRVYASLGMTLPTTSLSSSMKDTENGIFENSPKSTMSFVPRSNNMKMLLSLSLSESQHIRALQEHNARRLMQMYSPAASGNVSFRFPIRRDSLVGGARFIHAMMIAQNNH